MKEQQRAPVRPANGPSRIVAGAGRHLFTVLTAVFFVCAAPEPNADVPQSQAAEVEHLISYLENSDCSMVRNGKTHSGRDGAKHVQRKYDYFRDEISSTEEFIELSATKSTLSGRLYEVHCPGEEPQPSRDWLLQELKILRAIRTPR